MARSVRTKVQATFPVPARVSSLLAGSSASLREKGKALHPSRTLLPRSWTSLCRFMAVSLPLMDALPPLIDHPARNGSGPFTEKDALPGQNPPLRRGVARGGERDAWRGAAKRTAVGPSGGSRGSARPPQRSIAARKRTETTRPATPALPRASRVVGEIWSELDHRGPAGVVGYLFSCRALSSHSRRAVAASASRRGRPRSFLRPVSACWANSKASSNLRRSCRHRATM